MKSPVLLIAAAITTLALAACSDDSSNNPAGPAKELNSGNIPSGQSFVHTFDSPGNFGYHCTIHSAMTGSVTVSDAATDSAVIVIIANSTSTGFQPGAVTVKTNGKVTWNNTSGNTHTVTSH
jgi:plastocyanin